MTMLERLLEEKPPIVNRKDTSLPIDDPRHTPDLVKPTYHEDGIVTLYYEGWEFDWEEKIVSETDGVFETELITDLVGSGVADAGSPGDRMSVWLRWDDTALKELRELGYQFD